MARLRPWLQTGIFVLAVVFLGALIATQWQQLQAYPWQIEIGWLLLALALLWLTWLLELNQWRFILGRLGGSLRFGEAARQSAQEHRQRWEEGIGYLERETFDAFLQLLSLIHI